MPDTKPERYSTVENFGEVRSLLHTSAPSRATWQELTRLLDLCEPAQLEQLVHYIDEHFERWKQRGQMEGLVGSTYDLGDARESKSRSRGVRDELRVAPKRWVDEMVRGAFNTKHSLVRALDLTSSGLGSSQVCKLLTNPQMNQIEHIALSTSKKLTKSLVKVLCEPPLLNTVKSLRLNNTDFSYAVHWFSKHGQREGALENIDLTEIDWQLDQETISLPYLKNVKTLRSRQVWRATRTWEGHQNTRPPDSLEHLHLLDPPPADVLRVLDWRDCNLRTLRIEQWNTPVWDVVLSWTLPKRLELLEIELSDAIMRDMTESQRDAIETSLHDARLLKYIDTLGIGALKERIDLEKLANRFPDLEIQ